MRLRLTLRLSILVGGLLFCGDSMPAQRIFAQAPNTEAATSAAISDGRPLSQWIQQLQESSDLAQRVEACNAIAALGKAGRTAQPALIAAMKEKSNELRVAAFLTWEQVGGDPAAHVSVLSEVLMDKKLTTGTQDAAMQALARIGPAANSAVPALIELFRQPNRFYSRGYLENRFGAHSDVESVLAAVGSTSVPVLIEALKDKHADVRAGVAGALGGIGPKAFPAVPALIAALQDQEPIVRGHAVNGLAGIGLKADAAVSVLIRALADQGSYRYAIDGVDGFEMRRTVSDNAIRALERIGLAAAPALFEALQDSNPKVRRGAVAALGSIRPKPLPDAAVPVLLTLLKDEKQSVRIDAARVLSGVRPDAGETIDALVNALRDEEDDYIRIEVAQALTGVVPEREAIEAFVKSLRETDNSFVAETARDALRRMGAPAVPILLESLRGNDPVIRPKAIRALIDLGAQANAAIPQLIEALGDKDVKVRAVAAVALGKFKSSDGLQPLVRALQDSDPLVRGNAAYALGDLGSKAKTAVPALIELMQDNAGYFDTRGVHSQRTKAVGQIAVKALGAIGPDATTAVPALVEILQDEKRLADDYFKDDSFPCSVVVALGGIGPDAQAAVPALARIVGDNKRYDETRAAAVETLVRMGPPAKAAVPVLLEVMEKERYRPISVQAAGALFRINSNPEALQALIDLVQADPSEIRAKDAVRYESKKVQRDAIRILGEIGPAAKPAVPVLREFIRKQSYSFYLSPKTATKGTDVTLILKAPDEYERSQARDALAKIEQPAPTPPEVRP